MTMQPPEAPPAFLALAPFRPGVALPPREPDSLASAPSWPGAPLVPVTVLVPAVAAYTTEIATSESRPPRTTKIRCGPGTARENDTENRKPAELIVTLLPAPIISGLESVMRPEHFTVMRPPRPTADANAAAVHLLRVVPGRELALEGPPTSREAGCGRH